MIRIDGFLWLKNEAAISENVAVFIVFYLLFRILILSVTSAKFGILVPKVVKKYVLFALVFFQDLVQIHCFVWFRRLIAFIQFASHCLR